MAAGSDGVPDMVSGDDQPIDLSRTPRKPLRVMPPLIPIKLLRAGYVAQQANRQVKGSDITLASLIKSKAAEDGRLKYSEDFARSKRSSVDEGAHADEGRKDGEDGEGEEGFDGDGDGCGGGDDDEEDDEDEDDDYVSAGARKRARLANGEAEERRGGDCWQRLDRARSVPQLTPLPLPLLRSKSLSESRIPAAAAAGAAAATAAAAAAARPSDSPLPDELRLQLQAAAALRGAVEGGGAGGGDDAAAAAAVPPAALNNWIYVGYYSQLLHRFQAQEFLRRLALQHQQDARASQKADAVPTSKPQVPVQEEDTADIRRKQARPLTGKHVRPGTGASPATLLTLRRKIQARQQQHDLKHILE